MMPRMSGLAEMMLGMFGSAGPMPGTLMGGTIQGMFGSAGMMPGMPDLAGKMPGMLMVGMIPGTSSQAGRVAVCQRAGGQRKSLSWQAWQYILLPCSRKVPFCSWPRQ